MPGLRGKYIRTEAIRLKNSIGSTGQKHPGNGLNAKGRRWTEEQKKRVRGRVAWNSKGGTSKLGSVIRVSFRYRQWRSDIFQRDDYTCQCCGQRGGELNADHIKPFYLILKENKIETLKDAHNCEELWNMNNGRTLCLSCHKKTETYAKWKKVI